MPASTAECGEAIVSNFELASTDGSSTLQGTIWVPANVKPWAVVQVVHGMVEHIGCYDEPARSLCARGIVVCGIDQLGHGRTTPGIDERGVYDPKLGANQLIEDQHLMHLEMHRRYPDIPHILVGHSMGSFIARCLLKRHGADFDGYAILGTAWMAAPTLLALRAVVRTRAALKGWSYRSQFVNSMGVGSYNKRFEGTGAQVGFEWLSRDTRRPISYDADPDCGWVFSLSGYYTLAHLMEESQQGELAADAPQDVPVLIASGANDPVGDYGAAPERLYRELKGAGMTDVTLRIVDGARHELHNELDRAESLDSFCTWLEAHAAS